MSNQADTDTTVPTTEPEALSLEERLAKLERQVADHDADMNRIVAFMNDLSARFKRGISDVRHNLAVITKPKNGR